MPMQTQSKEMLKGKVGIEQFYDAFSWNVEKDQLYLEDANASTGYKAFPERFATVRVDTDGKRTALGVARGRYEVIQNAQVLETVEKILGIGGGEPFDYGIKDNGARFNFRLLFPKYLYPNVNDKNDFIQLCLAIKGSHDCSSGLTAEVQPIRSYCTNGLVWFGKSYSVSSVRHTSSAGLKLNDLGRVLGFAVQEFEDSGEALRKLSQRKMKPVEISDYVANVLGVKDENDVSTRSKNIADEILSLAHRGKGNRGETLWDAYNGVSVVNDKGIGLDKIDASKKEYSLANCVPCCGRCNWVKSDHFTKDEMVELGKVIKTFVN